MREGGREGERERKREGGTEGKGGGKEFSLVPLLSSMVSGYEFGFITAL